MLKTMAMKITRENHSVVAAIMPNWFLVTPLLDVIGRYVVINEVNVLGNDSSNQHMLEFTHTTYDEEDFDKRYKFARSELSNQFAEIDDTGLAV